MDNFIFVGRRVTKQPDGGFNLDQAQYVADVSLTKVTEPLDAPLANYPELVTELRSGVGSLQWLAGTTRDDVASYVSFVAEAAEGPDRRRPCRGEPRPRPARP